MISDPSKWEIRYYVPKVGAALFPCYLIFLKLSRFICRFLLSVTWDLFYAPHDSCENDIVPIFGKIAWSVEVRFYFSILFVIKLFCSCVWSSLGGIMISCFVHCPFIKYTFMPSWVYWKWMPQTFKDNRRYKVKITMVLFQLISLVYIWLILSCLRNRHTSNLKVWWKTDVWFVVGDILFLLQSQSLTCPCCFMDSTVHCNVVQRLGISKLFWFSC